MLPNQRYKSAATVIFFPISLLCFDNPDQSLSFARYAYRNYQSATKFELSYQRLWDTWTTCGNQYCIVGRMCGPP